MEQLRQRIAATCHIGPMDFEDTQHYIEHRLKCAGATDKPVFEPGAFEAIYAATNGIPRRINSLSDRLLLLGFLENKSTLSAEDVNEVASEFAKEGGLPTNQQSHAGKNGAHVLADVDVSRMVLDPGAADEISHLMGNMAVLQQGDRLQRLERSLLRLERISLETLTALQALVNAVKKKPSDESGQ
jgi:general secretion pathway protein A